ncbi:META domain-containing protein [Pseudochrobactrum sp. sp1633]|uniref:META domain-containing protein n=1 Tax=Pseudochrobactrum sp. sp1633 TaxID=3036706 RepID=UPI0025A606AF|nr:META domain-containing protein [Pseudochrobactrum sp. sp1633]MDM8344577.1 META domain-containing protein [Pseudochrobactrum sp. sp1633]HWD13662.1 META domain-containing protein [Pseudochrobactrum sp.]
MSLIRSGNTSGFIKTAVIAAGFILTSLSASFAAETGIYGNWITERIQGHKVHSKVQSTLDIAQDGKISGTGGCNRYMGGMEITGDKIKVTPIGGTMMACPPQMMQQDDKFHAALRLVSGWKVKKDRLILIDTKNREVLRLKRA